MTPRTTRLRQMSLDAVPSISAERALLMTAFYRENSGRWSPPVMRARAFHRLCAGKTIWIGDGELIVGERGPFPKAVPTFPELTCHSLDDLHTLNSRPKTAYAVAPDVFAAYQKEIIPYWQGRSLREQIFAALPPEWHAAYEDGVFTEFMEQRAPGHTVLDDKIYRWGLLDFKRQIAAVRAALDFATDAEAWDKAEQLTAMDIACDAVILFAERHAELVEKMAEAAPSPERRNELRNIAAICRRVPALPPETFHEALQAYWFCHLAVITELNGWDSFSPGHLDQHLGPFFHREWTAGTLTREQAKELLECFFIKFNNHPAPPKVGVTAAESGTYTDFANINIGGLLTDGANGSNPVSHLLLEIVDDMHLLQPSTNVQISRKTPEPLLRHALQVISKGFGFPSLFNADAVVEEQLRQGKTAADARAGGCSGCVEVGAFGKEAYILTGYFNLPKILELTLNNGIDPQSRNRLGPATGAAAHFDRFEDLLSAFETQLRHLLEIKIAGNQLIERIYARTMPAPFLSVLTDDCIARGKDYNAGGARYNNTYIQGVGIGTLTDSLAAIRSQVFEEQRIDMGGLQAALAADYSGREGLRQRLLNKTPKYGNDDDRADSLMRWVFDRFFSAVDGRPTARGGHYRIQMLPTTCHIYFGSMTGATPDGRKAGRPLSEGISPVQGADRLGPTAVVHSAAKMDHIRTGGTLLNMKLTPSLLETEIGIEQLANLILGYFTLGGHHIQFNVVKAATLRAAQAAPEEHRGLIVRVAGYSDYFCDLAGELQDEIIARTEHSGF